MSSHRFPSLPQPLRATLFCQLTLDSISTPHQTKTSFFPQRQNVNVGHRNKKKQFGWLFSMLLSCKNNLNDVHRSIKNKLLSWQHTLFMPSFSTPAAMYNTTARLNTVSGECMCAGFMVKRFFGFQLPYACLILPMYRYQLEVTKTQNRVFFAAGLSAHGDARSASGGAQAAPSIYERARGKTLRCGSPRCPWGDLPLKILNLPSAPHIENAINEIHEK